MTTDNKGRLANTLRLRKMIKIPDQVAKYKPGGKNVSKKHFVPMRYQSGKDAIDVFLWHCWPSYDFIFGLPSKSSRYYKSEAAFFQYRDTRARKIKCGFYVDKRELDILVKGFVMLSAAAFRESRRRSAKIANKEKP